MAADSIVFLTQNRREWLAGRYLSCAVCLHFSLWCELKPLCLSSESVLMFQWYMPELMSREKEIVDGDKLKMRMVL
jgi:hypothetical protein